MCIRVYKCIQVSLSGGVCVCVGRERDRGRGREGERKRIKGRHGAKEAAREGVSE